jgi:ABC-type sugar transport system substrate-binding protein
MKWLCSLAISSLAFAAIPGCGNKTASDKKLVVGVSFETLQTEYWVASFDLMKAELAARGFEIVEAVADGDPNRQLEQVNSFIARKVHGIIVVPRDANSVAPMIRAANKANIPIVLYNRSAAPGAGKSVTVVADNRAITRETVRSMIAEAKKTGRKLKGLVLIGDLSDHNAIARRDGFMDAIKEAPDAIEVVAEVPTEWNQEKALAGTTNAFQSHPDIEFIFSSSDFLFPSIVSVLKNRDKYKKIGEPGHVILGGFDGDATAYKMLVDGYLDADGVQDVAFECKQTAEAIVKMRAGQPVDEVLSDPGFVINQGNRQAEAGRMWGSKVRPERHAADAKP